VTPGEHIPKTLHYCWYGDSQISELSRRCIETWKEVMPDYAVEVWDESRLDMAVPYISTAYKSRRFAFVADYMRFKALYEHGGIYLDTDIEVLQRFDELLTNDLFFGLQTPESVGAGVIGATKKHPFLKLVLDKLDEEARSGKPQFQPLPELVTALVRSQPERAPVLFPEEYFYPYNPYSPLPLRQKPLQSNMSERTFCIHHWEGTWLGGMSLRMMIGLRLKHLMRKVNPLRRRRPIVHGRSDARDPC
jgi:mannosyltransferase OCH1-like enzyme